MSQCGPKPRFAERDAEIRLLHSSRVMGLRRLAKKFGISKVRVQQILNPVVSRRDYEKPK